MAKLNKIHIFLTFTCLYAVFIFYLSSLSITPEPPTPGFLYEFARQLEALGLQFLLYPLYYAYKYPDKFVHMLLYLGFGLLLNLTLSSSKNSRISKYAAPLAILIGTIYAITDEIHQYFVPYRTASALDLYADLLGLLLAQLLLIFYSGIKKSRELQHKKSGKIRV